MPDLMMRPWPDDGEGTPYALDTDSGAAPAGGAGGGAADPATARPAADAAVARPVRCPDCGAGVVWLPDGSAVCIACRWVLDEETHAAIIARQTFSATTSEPT